jgi:hypothetical protein
MTTTSLIDLSQPRRRQIDAPQKPDLTAWPQSSAADGNRVDPEATPLNLIGDSLFASSSTGEVSSDARSRGCGILCSGRCSSDPGIGPVAPRVDAVIGRSSADAMVDGVGGPSRVSSRTDSTGGETVGLASRRVLTALGRVGERSSKASVC